MAYLTRAAEPTDALVADKLSLAFLRQPFSDPSDLIFHRLLEEEMFLVLPVGHAALKNHTGKGLPTISLAALRDEPFILMRFDSAKN